MQSALLLKIKILTSSLANTQRSFHASVATMASSIPALHIPITSTSYPNNPIPEEPAMSRKMSLTTNIARSPPSTINNSFSDVWSNESGPSTPATDIQSDLSDLDDGPDDSKPRERRASTMLVSQNSEDVRRLLGSDVTTEIIKNCCGGGCCIRQVGSSPYTGLNTVVLPRNRAFKSLNIKSVDQLGLETELTYTVDLPPQTVSFDATAPAETVRAPSDVAQHPP